jgi:hypothetical protein
MANDEMAVNLAVRRSGLSGLDDPTLQENVLWTPKSQDAFLRASKLNQGGAA